MHHEAVPLLCERDRVHFPKPRWYSQHTAGLRVQPVAPGCKAVLHGAGLHTAGNCNTMLSTGYRNLSKHRKGTVKYNTKEKKCPTYLGNLP